MPGTSERLFVSPGMPGPQGLPGGHLNAVSTEILPDTLREKIAVRAGGSWNSRYQFLPWVDDANGETRTQVDAYLEMVTRDDAIKAALLTKIYSVSSLDWQAHPVSDSPRDKLVSDFVLWNYQQSEGGTASIVEELLLPALIKKYSVCEIVRREEPHAMGRWQGKMCLQQLKAREYATLEEDAFGNVTGVLGPGYRGGQSRFDLIDQATGLRNFVVLKNLSIFGRPISDMRPVYRWYLAKDTLIKLWLIGLEKYGNPYLIGTYPDGADDIRLALEARMGQFKAGHYGVFPEGAKIDFTTALTSAANFEAAIDRCDKGIYTAVNGAFLQSMTSSGVDQRGNAQVQKSTSELFNWRLAEVVKSVVNTQLTPDFVRENFAKADTPLISLGAINETDMKASADLDKALLDMGYPLSLKDGEKRYSRKLAKPGSEDDLSAKKQAQQGGGMGGMFGGGMTGGMPQPDPMADAPPMGDEMEPPDADVQFADDLADEGADHDLSHDDARATQLLEDARANATDTLGDIVGRALHRNLAGNPGRIANARDFFSPQELRELQAMYRDILGPAELLGRSRLALRTEQAEKFHADRASDVHHITRRFSDAPPVRFSDVPTDLHIFNDAGDQGTPIRPMPPRDALDFFRRLVPGLKINPERFGQFLERESFTLAAATEQTILDRVQELIGNRIDTGEGISTAPDDIEALLDEIGVTPRNPQYAEMVVRTNMMDAYNTGAQRQAAESSEMFPAWQYSNPDDGRSRPEHAARNGQYYPTTLPFFAVRGTEIGDAANCRCTPRYIDKWEWSDLQNGGARFAQTGTRRFSDAWTRYRMDTHHFAWTQFKTRTGSVGAIDDKGRKRYGKAALSALNPKRTPKTTSGQAKKTAATPKDAEFHPDVTEAITGMKVAPTAAKEDPVKAQAKARAEQKQAQKDFEAHGLPKIKSFESRTGRPWMDLVLRQAGQASGQSVQEMWHSIAQGDRVPHVDAILANEDFQHDYGKVSSGSFAGIVQALKSSGYVPAAKYRGQTAANARAGEGERPKGMISDLADSKLKSLLPGGEAPKPMPSAARKTTRKDDAKGIPLGDPAGGKSSVYDAFGIKSPEQEKEERQKFESVHLPKIKAFEQRTGQPWLDMVLRQAGQESGKSPEQMWQTLSQGGHTPEVDRILSDENFAHDYGTMTPDDLGKMVGVLKNAGYIPAAKYRGSTRGDKAERAKGMISDVPSAKLKKAGLTTSTRKKFADALVSFFRRLWR